MLLYSLNRLPQGLLVYRELGHGYRQNVLLGNYKLQEYYRFWLHRQ